MALNNSRKVPAQIGIAITTLMLAIGSQAVNVSPATSLEAVNVSPTTSQTPPYSVVDLNDLYPEGELIYDGGFELDPYWDADNPKITNRNIMGWTKSGNPLDTSIIQIINYPHSGKQALVLRGFNDLSYISQIISTVPGKYYKLTYYLGVNPYTTSIENEFQTIIGGNIVWELKDIYYQKYTEYDFIFRAEESSTEIKFGSVNKHGYYLLDNVSVKEVPSPSNQSRQSNF